MPDGLDLKCQVCGHVGLDDGSDGFYYCQQCNSQAEDIRDTAVDDDEFHEGGDNPQIGQISQLRRRTVAVDEPVSQSQLQSKSQFWDSLRIPEDGDDTGNGVGPTGPSDFGSGLRTLSYEDYYSEIRLRYVMGVQIMIELQCKALVEKFQVSPLIVGLAGPIWLRFVASTRVFADSWADEAIQESESHEQGQTDDFEPRTIYRTAEPYNILGERAVMIWYRCLSKMMPLSYSLVISFLVCHVAREAILPTDILKWTLEGKLPYFAAFVEIERQIGPTSSACPISSSHMFRPIHAVSLQKLESLAASVAQAIGLELPSVNFYATASRYLRQLSLPVAKILPHACRIYEWSMPPELWLSANELRLPTRACVMAILIVSMRILYNINGFGNWEMSLSGCCGSSSSAEHNEESKPMCNTDKNDEAKQGSPSHDWDDTEPCDNSSDIPQSELDAAELLSNLEAKFDELGDTCEYLKDLPTYLRYCKDVVFTGLEPSFDDHEEGQIIEDLWDFYQNKKGSKPSDDQGVGSLGRSSGYHKRSRDDIARTPKESKKFRDDGCTRNPSDDGGVSLGDDCSQYSMNSGNGCQRDENSLSDVHPGESQKDRAIRRMRSNMEENRCFYIPPRVNVKKFDYLQYVRKKDKGAYSYALHADYYILLRSCARVVQLDIRTMHAGVLGFERRLAWLEKRMDHCLTVKPPSDSCEFCRDDVEQNDKDDSMDFSKLNL